MTRANIQFLIVEPDIYHCLLQVQHYLKLSQETLYISISLLDNILEKRDVDQDKLQLVGITALFLASKMEEYHPANVKKLVHLTEDTYSVQDVFNMELVLLGVIDFQVTSKAATCAVLLLDFTMTSGHSFSANR